LEKSTKGFSGVFLNPRAVPPVILLATIIFVLSCIAAVVCTWTNGRVTVLSATVTTPETVGRAVLNESETKAVPEQSDQWQTMRMRVTAYCPCQRCCGKYSDSQTACGHKIRPGDAFVAADKQYSFGTEMVIPGYSNAKPVKVLDRGGRIRGNRLDIFFHSHQEALKWGVKLLDVKIRRQ
jgi:3D (Asp-Asp-Asp) domain-containing protein